MAPFDGNACGLLTKAQLAAVEVHAPCVRNKTVQRQTAVGTLTFYLARYARSPEHYLYIGVVKASAPSVALAALKKLLDGPSIPGVSVNSPATLLDPQGGGVWFGTKHKAIGHGKPDERSAIVAFVGGDSYACAIVAEDDNGAPNENSLLRAVERMVTPVRVKLKFSRG